MTKSNPASGRFTSAPKTLNQEQPFLTQLQRDLAFKQERDRNLLLELYEVRNLHHRELVTKFRLGITHCDNLVRQATLYRDSKDQYIHIRKSDSELHLQGILPGKEYTMPEGSWIDIEKLKGHLDNELKKEYPFLQPYDTGVIVLVNEIAKIDFRIRVLLGDDSGHNLIGESRLRDIR